MVVRLQLISRTRTLYAWAADRRPDAEKNAPVYRLAQDKKPRLLKRFKRLALAEKLGIGSDWVSGGKWGMLMKVYANVHAAVWGVVVNVQ